MKSTITFTLPLSSTAETRVFTSVFLIRKIAWEPEAEVKKLGIEGFNFYLYGIILVFIGSQTKSLSLILSFQKELLIKNYTLKLS